MCNLIIKMNIKNKKSKKTLLSLTKKLCEDVSVKNTITFFSIKWLILIIMPDYNYSIFKMNIAFALVGYKMIITNSMVHVSLAIYHLTHIRPVLME